MSKLNTENKLFNTRAVHAGSEPCPVTGAHVAPIYRTSTFVMKNAEEAMAAGAGDPEGKYYVYSRNGNPTIHAVQKKIAALENAEAALMTALGWEQ